MTPFALSQARVEEEIDLFLASFKEKTSLIEACTYALKSGGKRVRPLLVYAVAEGVGHGLDVNDAAVSVEFFHTASLIADDLPCMDNDAERRNKPTLHRVFGESVALLASYALITAAFEKIHQNGKKMLAAPDRFSSHSERATVLSLECASKNAGILGATGGQFLDLFPQNRDFEMLKKIIHLKTITLFEVAFVFGWVFGGGDFSKLSQVKQAAYHLGMAFQMADDLADIEQDSAAGKWMNCALFLGVEKTRELFLKEMEELEGQLELLQLNTPLFQEIVRFLRFY